MKQSVIQSINSVGFARHGDKENSAFFEEYLIRLLEERDQVGLTAMIHEIDALMITVDPGHSIQYIAELALMTSYHYLVTLESESHWTHVLRIDLDSPDILLREVKDPTLRGIFRSLNEVYPVGAKKPNSRYMARSSVSVICMMSSNCSMNGNFGFSRRMRSAGWSCRATWRSANLRLIPIISWPILSAGLMS